MKNINRDYLVKINVKTAKITPAPKELKFFMTDVWTSNIFFQLEGIDNSNDALQENADIYSLTLRVVKPNGEPKTIKVDRLGEETSLYYVADLDVSFVDIPGIYECELFMNTTINGRAERSTTDPFEYEVKESIFYNLDNIIDTKVLAIEDIATVDYVNSLAIGGVSLEGYATNEQLNTKANKEHIHNDYVTQTQLNNALASDINIDINLENLVVEKSISMNRKANTAIGQYSTAVGRDVAASGYYSHAEGVETTASGVASHAEGSHTTANGEASHTEGYKTTANGYTSHAEGFYTTARGRYQHVQGKYNVEDTENKYAHIVGNGVSSDHSNAHTLDWHGNAWFAGDVYVGVDNKILATREYINNMLEAYGIVYDDTELKNLITNKADKDHTHDEYATTEYIDSKLWVGTQAEYNAIRTKDPNIIYFIEED